MNHPTNHKIVLCHISTIKVGDTVIHEGQMITISRSNLKRGGFMGTTICGDSYRMGTVSVQRVVFITKGRT